MLNLPIGMTKQNRRMPGTDELHVALPHVQHRILHSDKPTKAQIALTEQTVEHLHDALGISTMAHTGTKLAHEPGHLHCCWDAFPGHVPEEPPYPVGIEAYGIIQIAPDPRSWHRRRVQAQARSLWKRGGKHLALDLAGNFQIAFDTFVLGDGDQGCPQGGQSLRSGAR